MPIHVLDDLTPDMALQIIDERRCAVDTETSGLDWRADRLEICQVYSPSTGPIIIRNTGQRPRHLATVLESTDVQSIYHFAPFDLRFLEHHWGVRARTVGCTKTASRVRDPDLCRGEHSLQPLVQRRLGVHLDKGAVRTSDWGAETLTVEQLDYAASDVRFLLELHDGLTSKFTQEQSALYAAMCAYLPVDAHREIIGIPDPLVH